MRLTRTRLNLAFVVTVTAALLAASGIVGGGVLAARAANEARRQAIGNRLLADAVAIDNSDPAGALLLRSLAVRLGAPGARAALVQDLMAGHYAGTLSGSDRAELCDGPQAWSPDGRYVATTGPTGVTVWDSRQRRIARTLGTRGPVSGCAFAPDGVTLAAAVEGDLVLFFLPNQPSDEVVWTNPGIGAEQVQFAPNGLLAIGSADASVQLWSVERSDAGMFTSPAGTVPSTAGRAADGRHSLAFSPDSRTLAIAGRAATALVDVSRPAAPQALASMPGVPDSVAFSPDGNTLAVGRDAATVLWDVRDRARPKQRASVSPPQRLGLPVTSVSFTADGARLITSGGGLGEVWRVGGDAAPEYDGELAAGAHQVTEMAVAPDGVLAVVQDAGGPLNLWQVSDRTTPPALATLPLDPIVVTNVRFLASEATTLVVTANKAAATLWDVTNPATPRQIQAASPDKDGEARGFGGLAQFSADGRRFAQAETEDTIVIREIGLDGRFRRVGTITITGRRQLIPAALSPDGTLLAVSTDRQSRDDPEDPIALWDVRGEPRVVGYLPQDLVPGAAGARLARAAFSPDGRTLVTHATGQTATWWSVVDPAAPVRLAERAVAREAFAGAVAFTPDGRLVVTTDPGSPGALWDTTNPAVPQLLSYRPGFAGGRAGDVVFAGPALVAGTLGAMNV